MGVFSEQLENWASKFGNASISKMNAETELLKLAKERFTNLSSAEVKLFSATAKRQQFIVFRHSQ
jgi:hypothetical protein